MTLREILEEWEKDSKIDPMDLGAEALKTPRLHQKYLRLLMGYKQKKIKVVTEVKEQKRKAYLFYTGKAHARDYEGHEFGDVKVLKSETGVFIDADPEYRGKESALETVDAAIYSLEAILKQVAQRDWQIRQAIEFEKFMGGA